MFEYPSIKNTKRVKFGDRVIVFDKVDGSNFRAKWTRKHGFNLFGTRTQLVDESTDFWGSVVKRFNETAADKLSKFFFDKTKADNLIVFSEFFGPNSFAGRHNPEDTHELYVFDVYDIKLKSFMPPDKFIERITPLVLTPTIISENSVLNYDLIQDVREGKYGVNEGVICKGLARKGNFAGSVPMYKIKTKAYLDKLRDAFADEWEKYAE